jgi:hypothetical protein
MPSTVPTHPMAVLPLKLLRPRLFDGVALAAGAASPDVAYLIDGSGLPVWPFSHEWRGLVGWCLPVTVVLVLALRAAAPVVAAHLPPAGVLALRDYGALGRVRHPWWVTASSALVGGASHIVFDDLTNVEVGLDIAAEMAGVLGTLALMVHIGRRRLILAWHGPAPVVRRRPRLFWGAATLVGLPGAVAVLFLPVALLPHTTGVRLIAVATLALLAGAMAGSLRGVRRRRHSHGEAVAVSKGAAGGVGVDRWTRQGRMEP